MANPHPIPNMDIGNEIKVSAKTPIGQLRRNIKLFNRDYIAQFSPEVLELYDWLCSNDTKKIDYLLELKNIYQVMQQVQFPSILDKIERNESLSKRDIDTLRLMKEVLSESHKLKYGDKHVIENVVTVADIRKQMMSDKKIIDAKVLNDTIRQIPDNSGSGEDGFGQDGDNSGNNELPEEVQENS